MRGLGTGSWMLLLAKRCIALLEHWMIVLHAWVVKHEHEPLHSEQMVLHEKMLVSMHMNNAKPVPPAHWLQKTKHIQGQWLGTSNMQTPSRTTLPIFNAQNGINQEKNQSESLLTSFSLLHRVTQRIHRVAKTIRGSRYKNQEQRKRTVDTHAPISSPVANTAQPSSTPSLPKRQRKAVVKVATTLEENLSFADISVNHHHAKHAKNKRKKNMEVQTRLHHAKQTVTTQDAVQPIQSESIQGKTTLSSNKINKPTSATATSAINRAQIQSEQDEQSQRNESRVIEDTQALVDTSTNDWPELPVQSAHQSTTINTESKMREFQRLQMLEQRQRRPPWIV